MKWKTQGKALSKKKTFQMHGKELGDLKDFLQEAETQLLIALLKVLSSQC